MLGLPVGVAFGGVLPVDGVGDVPAVAEGEPGRPDGDAGPAGPEPVDDEADVEADGPEAPGTTGALLQPLNSTALSSRTAVTGRSFPRMGRDVIRGHTPFSVRRKQYVESLDELDSDPLSFT